MRGDGVSTRGRIGRRAIVKGMAGMALAAPFLSVRGAAAAGRLVIRSLGGAYEEAATKVHFEPFTKATGIEIVKLPATFSKLMAMHQAGNVEIDILDIGEIGIIQLSRAGALLPIDYKSWKQTDIADVDKEVVRPDAVGHMYFSTVLGYNTKAIAPEKAPRGWVDFWDAARFPGPRMLSDLASGSVDLEQALIADGVPLDKLYPIDLPRAFKSLTRIRPHVRKFWDTGALSAQMLADQEVVMGTIWNTRLQAALAKGAPLAIEWNGGMLQVQGWSIAKGTKNPEGAQRFIEFAMDPGRQAQICMQLPNGPTNRAAFKSIPEAMGVSLPSFPAHRAKQFVQSAEWWADNRGTVAEEWSKWLLQTR
ncbi:MAG: ABC transporter substrate-binding protein [Alphaproteobacteria bacterium]|nr:ABC transporter substrate-binding protein [Alphaproteobacteria bacterium]